MPKQLWAPWRMQYILENDSTGECFLCAAGKADDDRADLVVGRQKHCFCILNRYPYNNGHILIAPYAHKADLCDLDDAERVGMMQALCEMERRLREAMNPDGFNIGINVGKVSGAGLPGHVHFHVVPRWEGDTNFMPVLADTKVMPQALEDVFDLLTQQDQ
jgi:ATP adenylyltransferase